MDVILYDLKLWENIMLLFHPMRITNIGKTGEWKKKEEN